MAHGIYKPDPAIDRFNSMRESAYLNFRWTRKTVTTAVLGFIIVPTALFYATASTNARWNWNGKRKGESLSISPSANPQPTE